MAPPDASAAANNTDTNQREAAISALSTRSSAGLFHSPFETLFHYPRRRPGRMDYRPCGAAASPARASPKFAPVGLDGLGSPGFVRTGRLDYLPQAHDRFVVRAFAGEHQPERDQRQVRRLCAQHLDAAVERGGSRKIGAILKDFINDLRFGRRSVQKVGV